MENQSQRNDEQLLAEDDQLRTASGSYTADRNEDNSDELDEEDGDEPESIGEEDADDEQQ